MSLHFVYWNDFSSWKLLGKASSCLSTSHIKTKAQAFSWFLKIKSFLDNNSICTIFLATKIQYKMQHSSRGLETNCEGNMTTKNP